MTLNHAQSPLRNDTHAALDDRSLALRRLIARALINGGRGHPGPALSIVEILRVLYDDVLQVRPQEPQWSDRDRFILSKGHGCLALYAILADKGFFSDALLDDFCKHDAVLGGHPEYGHGAGIEASTGSLGHGLPIGVGVALGIRMSGRRSRVFVLVGDGELNEGSVWEGALAAAKHKLEHLTVLVDYNKLQSYGPVSEVLGLEPLADKWRSFGFAVTEVDGHNVDELRQTLLASPSRGKPSAIICHTVKGYGIPRAENNPQWHHKNKFSKDELAEIKDVLGML